MGDRQPNRAWRIATMLGILVTLCALVPVWYRPREFTGAGPLRDDGLFSYPRYHAPIGALPFAKEGTTIFHFSGMPARKMSLSLHAPGFSSANREMLARLSTTIRAELLDASRNVLCSATGSPSERQWILMSSVAQAAFWHERFRDVALSDRMNYSLRVTITNLDPNTPNVTLQVRFEGGGIELP